MNATKRLVCYAINGSGLGHLTRLTAVARWLRRYVTLLDNRTPEVIFLTSSDASDALASAGFAAFKIPSKTVAKKAELNKLEYRRLAKHFVWNTLGVFSPDLFVVDTFPSGSFDELFQVLDGPFKKGFIYRDVKPEYAARPTFRSALGLYDTIVAPHHRDGVETNGSAPTGDIRYCGEVIQFEREDLLPTADARQQLGVTDGHRIVYISAGGGGDPHAEATLASLIDALQDEPDTHLLVGAGPLYRGRRLSGPRLTWFDSPNAWRYFSAVDAAVCAAGYNTFHELLFARVPTAFYAQTKIADDQGKRIEMASSAHACQSLSDATDSKAVLQSVRELLNQETAKQLREGCERFILENGARKCALELLRPLYSESRLHWAASVLTPAITHSLERINDGASNAIASWLTTLVPLGQIQAVASHPGLDGVINRLSPAAAKEVETLLADSDQLADFATFESHLIKLLDSVDVIGRMDSSATGVRFLAAEVLKTISAAIKKQPLETARNGNYARWVCTIVDCVHGLLQLAGDDVNVADVLHLYRVFPRIVDVTTQESFDFFVDFLQSQRTKNASTHEVLRQLQVMKLTHTKITAATMQAAIEGYAEAPQ